MCCILHGGTFRLLHKHVLCAASVLRGGTAVFTTDLGAILISVLSNWTKHVQEGAGRVPGNGLVGCLIRERYRHSTRSLAK